MIQVPFLMLKLFEMQLIQLLKLIIDLVMSLRLLMTQALVISTENGEGVDIAGKNVLNLNANFYQRDFEQSLLSLDQSPAEIRLGLGENGSPKDLEIGF